MESVEHLAISVFLGLPAVYLIAFPQFTNIPLLIFLYVFGVACGVLIDLDHFIVSRFNNGDWNHLRKALKDPYTVMTDNDQVVNKMLTDKQRFASHLFIAMIAPMILVTADLPLYGAMSAVMFDAHILADVFQEWRS